MAEKKQVTTLGDAVRAAVVTEFDRSNRQDEPPVVARVMIEIRSDGSRTIARGAMEDLMSGENVAIEARGTSLLNVALQLAGSMRSLPSLIRGHAAPAKELEAGAPPTRIRRRDQLRQRAFELLTKIK